ncbi:MAG: hypothetical protein SGJ02_13745 [bacterium]|nr:hypothetical protein [bacterium]
MSALIILGEKILSLDSSVPESIVDKLEQYTKAFSEWLTSFDKDLNKLSETEKNTLLKLSLIHSDLLELAKSGKVKTLQDLRELDVRGKAIMSYLDQMPKRISKTGVKKG